MRLSRHHPLSPNVMVFYNLNTKIAEVAQLDLSKVEDEIVDSVSPEDFDISLPVFLRQSFFSK
jgi:hypothetical protein